jgi:hypothetical protein
MKILPIKRNIIEILFDEKGSTKSAEKLPKG